MTGCSRAVPVLPCALGALGSPDICEKPVGVGLSDRLSLSAETKQELHCESHPPIPTSQAKMCAPVQSQAQGGTMQPFECGHCSRTCVDSPLPVEEQWRLPVSHRCKLIRSLAQSKCA